VLTGDLVFLEQSNARYLIKLTWETIGNVPRVLNIPYPTWFRYYPDMESKSSANITVHSSNSTPSNPQNKQCSPPWNLTRQLQRECDGREFCTIVIPDKAGRNKSHPEGWGEEICAHELVGSFSCGEGTLRFRTKVRSWQRPANWSPTADFETASGSTGTPVVLSCRNGPCWLWGNCEHTRMRQVQATGDVQPGPLASFIGSCRSSVPSSEHTTRNSIIEQCLARPDLCVLYATGSRDNSTSAADAREQEMYQLLLASTFCINPPGDTETRKAIFDALVLGCIPVIFHPQSLSNYPIHLPHWQSVSVLVSESQFTSMSNLFDYLNSISQEEILRKQMAIRDVGYSLQYSWQSGRSVRGTRGPDAFDKTLEYLLSFTDGDENITLHSPL